MVIFAANLNFRLQESQLQQLFEEYGTVTSARIITDRQTGRSKGYGFIEMPDDSQAKQAITALDGFTLEGKEISVKEGRPQSERPAGPRRTSNFRDDRGGDRGGDRRGGGGYGNRQGGNDRGGDRGGNFNRDRY